MFRRTILNDQGFTFIELLVAMMLSGIVMAAIYNVFISFNRTYVREDAAVNAVQNARAAIDLMAREIRMSGYRGQFIRSRYQDPVTADDFGIMETGRITVNGVESGMIRFQMDLTGAAGEEDGLVESYEYGLYDFPVTAPDGSVDLYRSYDGDILAGGGPQRQLLVENVDGLEFAYAYDDNLNDKNRDPVLDANFNVVWAIDRNGDGQLDTDIDTNDDGVVSVADNPAGTAIGPIPVTGGRIRAIKIWLLVRVDRVEKDYLDTETYVLGNKRYRFDDGSKRVLLTRTVRLWNEGLRDD